MQTRHWDGQISTGCHPSRRATPIISVRHVSTQKGCEWFEMQFHHFKGGENTCWTNTQETDKGSEREAAILACWRCSWQCPFADRVLCLLVYADKNTNEVEAKAFLEEYNSTAEVVWNAYTEASWSYNTDINEENKNEMVSQSDRG